MTSSHPFGKLPSDVPANPFTLSIPESDLSMFRKLLELSEIVPETWENKQEKFGVTRDWLIKAKRTWLDDFDWRQHEARINSFPNFKTTVKDAVIGDTSIHFVALFSAKSDAVPLLWMHGWPGSFIEFLPMLEVLTKKYTPQTLPYHVVVASLPGYTLSSGPPLDRDFTMGDCARIMNQLMVDLGFGKQGYMAQGGDVGGFVAPIMSTNFEECKAIHLNIKPMWKLHDTPPKPNEADPLTQDETEHAAKAQEFFVTGDAYAKEHGTRPGTISAVLSSNPMALLAWIGEKMIHWADDREPIPLDTILLNASLYWFTRCFPRSIWPYRGLLTIATGTPDLTVNPNKPLGYSYFPVEIAFLPKSANRKNLVRYDHQTGGHFAALEQPESLLADVEDFVTRNKGLVSKP